MKDNLYVVYHVKYKGEIVYIGHGNQHRPAHAVSGISHVYELNALHHKGESVVVDIVFQTLCKEDAVSKEREDILNYQPAFNTVYLKSSRQDAAAKAISTRSYIKTLKSSLRQEYFDSKACQKAIEVIDTMLSLFSIQQLISGVQLSGLDESPFPQLRRFISGDKKTSDWYKILCDKEVFEFYRNDRKHCFARLLVS